MKSSIDMAKILKRRKRRDERGFCHKALRLRRREPAKRDFRQGVALRLRGIDARLPASEPP